MSIDKNKKLYQEILASVNNSIEEEGLNFNILNTGSDCILNMTPSFNLVNENDNGVTSEIIVGEAYVSGTGNVSFSGLPPFVNRRGDFYDQHFANVELLLHMDGVSGSTSFTDSSSNNLVITASGDALVSTSQGKFGQSVLFDGSGDALLITDSGSAMVLGTDDFTIECWLYTSSNSVNLSNFGTIFAGGTNAPVVRYHSSYSGIVVGVAGVGYDIIPSPAALPIENSWNHLAIVRDSTSLRFYLNGSFVDFGANSNNYSAAISAIGLNPPNLFPFSGFIDDFRITRNVARYTGSTYSVPTQPFGETDSLTGIHEFYIESGTVIDYEIYGTGQTSRTWTISGTMSSDCSDSFDVVLYDQNDEVPSFSYDSLDVLTVCSGAYTNIGQICLDDQDITDSYRNLTLSLQAYESSLYSLSTGNLTASGCVDVYINTTGIAGGLTVLSAELVADDGTNVSTGILQVGVEYEDTTILNRYNRLTRIPIGLSSSVDNPIVLAHSTPYNYIDINTIYDSTSGCNILTITGLNTEFDTLPTNAESVLYDVSGRFIETYIAGDLGAYFVSGAQIFGVGQFGFTSSAVPSGNGCCGVENLSTTTVVTFINALDAFTTGIGPSIPFSGGSGNVELSYFEPLGSGSIVLAPRSDSSSLSSNDNSFYIYTYGDSSYQEVTHPTETGLREVVGAASSDAVGDNYVLCTYTSNNSSVFKYNVSSQSWTSFSPFGGSKVTRVIKLDHDYGKYLVVGIGSGMYSLYDSVSSSLVSITDATATAGMILPENIALIADNEQATGLFTTSRADNMASSNNRYHIFALDHHYSGSVSGYPFILDIDDYNIYSGEFSLSGNTSNDTTYLHGYLNHRPDIITVGDRMAISLSNTGNGLSELIIRDNTTSSIERFSSAGDKRRLTQLINDQILWSSYSSTGISTVIDPYTLKEYAFPVPLTGSISVAASCNNEYRTLMLDSQGDKAYVLNDLDRTYTTLSFTGSVPMGTYHDVIVFDQLSNAIDQSHSFYLMPTQIYEEGFPTGNLAVISTTAIAATGISISGDFDINETVVSFEPYQTTTGLVEVGTYQIATTNEFYGVFNVDIGYSSDEDDIFAVSISGSSGIIYIRSGIALDYETKNTYFATISGSDIYTASASNFSNTFQLNILDIDEKPTGVVFDPPSSGGYNHNLSVNTDKAVATFSVQDPDESGNINIVSIGGADAGIFSTVFDNDTQNGFLYVKSGTVFDIDTKDRYYVTLSAAKSGESPSASGDWVLYLTDNPPIALALTPNSTEIPENYSVPITGLKLADFTIRDDDTDRDNFVHLIGEDASYFTIDYTLGSDNGTLYLAPDSLFDYETKTQITAQVAAGNIIGRYSTTGIFTVNITDIFEASGITVTPNIVYLPENTDTQLARIKLADLSWEDPGFLANPFVDMVIFDLRDYGSGYRSATDRFEIVDNETRTPELYLKRYASLDYETKNKHDIIVSGRPDFSTDSEYFRGGLFTLIIQDVNDAPVVSFDPTGITIQDTTATAAGRFKIADIYVKDEELSTVSFSISGADSGYFTMEINDDIQDSFTASNVGSLYFNSGVSLDISTKNTYTGIVVATDSSGLFDAESFILNLSDSGVCPLVISETLTNNRCSSDAFGRISVNVTYTGIESDNCLTDSPLSIVWKNLPSSSVTGYNGRIVNLLPNGTYSGFIYGGNIPLTGISYNISSTAPDIIITQTTKYNPPCISSGYLTIQWSGGTPPYYVNYGNSFTSVASGSGSSYDVNLSVYQNITARPIIRDSLGCVHSGETLTFSFPNRSNFSYESQSTPIIHNDTLESYKFNVSHGNGPYDLNIYHTTTGEIGELALSFDKYDTSIIDRPDIYSSIYTDITGGTSVRLSNANSQTYYYDLQNVLYPGTYIFEFVNLSGCLYKSDIQSASNIPPLTTAIEYGYDLPSDNGYYNISQPVLDTLFIPYKMLVRNSNLLSYLSSLDEKSDFHLEIGGVVYERKVLNGSVNCDGYAFLNISFLGVDESEWFYPLSFYQGFDLTDQGLDIKSKDIYFVLPGNNKIKVVQEINNNINTIKLLKGSILTNDLNTSQYKDNETLGLFNYSENTNTFLSMDGSAKIFNTQYLTDVYFPGNIFRIDFLNHPSISARLRSDAIESVNFDCILNQKSILNNRTFLASLNNFGVATNIYAKSISYVGHGGYYSLIVSGGYGEYTISHYYYDQDTKCVSQLMYNNQPLSTFDADALRGGVYILKVRDIYGNKLNQINGTTYDQSYISTLDFILNELDTTTENLGFEYGDLLLNLIDLSKTPVTEDIGIVPGVPAEPSEPVEPAPPDTAISTNTHRLSPNTTYNNQLIIQTVPGKIPFTVTGPYGYNHKFYDRSILLQLPPGVYTIKGDVEALSNRYLYPQTKTVSIGSRSNILINMAFDSYQDQTIIQDSCNNNY